MSEKKELKIRKRTTNIQEDTRRALDITRDEYAFCGYVQYRQAYPEQKKRGFCCDGKDELAYFVGISRAGLYKMIDRLSASGLLDVEAATGFLSVTKKWIDGDSGCKQSRQPEKNGVNKVDTNCQLSLQGGVNLVTGNIEVQLEDKLEQEEIMSAQKTADGLPEKPSLDANPSEGEKTPSPPAKKVKADPNDCRKVAEPLLEAMKQEGLRLVAEKADPQKIERLRKKYQALEKDIRIEYDTDKAINLLNELVGTEYETETPAYRKLARLRFQKYSYAQMELVIRYKVKEWKDNDKMRGYLRPSTLFNGSFAEYLEAAKLDKQSPLTPKDGQPLRLEPAPERQPVRDYVE